MQRKKKYGKKIAKMIEKVTVHLSFELIYDLYDISVIPLTFCFDEFYQNWQKSNSSNQLGNDTFQK